MDEVKKQEFDVTIEVIEQANKLTEMIPSNVYANIVNKVFDFAEYKGYEKKSYSILLLTEEERLDLISVILLLVEEAIIDYKDAVRISSYKKRDVGTRKWNTHKK